MAIPSFYLGTVVKVTVNVSSDATSTAGVEPAGLTVYLTEPDGSTYSYVRGVSTAISSGLTSGQFVFTWPSAKEGLHRGGIIGTGSNAGADDFSFNILQRGW